MVQPIILKSRSLFQVAVRRNMVNQSIKRSVSLLIARRLVYTMTQQKIHAVNRLNSHKQVCVTLSTYVDNVALPHTAAAAID